MGGGRQGGGCLAKPICMCQVEMLCVWQLPAAVSDQPRPPQRRRGLGTWSPALPRCLLSSSGRGSTGEGQGRIRPRETAYLWQGSGFAPAALGAGEGAQEGIQHGRGPGGCQGGGGLWVITPPQVVGSTKGTGDAFTLPRAAAREAQRMARETSPPPSS